MVGVHIVALRDRAQISTIDLFLVFHCVLDALYGDLFIALLVPGGGYDSIGTLAKLLQDLILALQVGKLLQVCCRLAHPLR